MSRLSSALSAAAVALGVGAALPAAAQTTTHRGAPVNVPTRVSHPAAGRVTGFDCVIEGLSAAVYPRRVMTFVDVAVRVRSLRGGFCAVRPDAVQVQGAKPGATIGRFTALFLEDGQPRWPGEVTEFRSANERLDNWVGDLKPNETRTITLRGVFEGDLTSKGDLEPPAKVNLMLSTLGPRLLPGAPADLRLVLEPNVAARVLATTVNGNKQGHEPVAAGATFQARQTLDMGSVMPLFDWRYEGEGPPAPKAADALASPLALLEYLRHGLVRDVAAAHAGKDAKRLAAVWDESLDVTFAAARSEDPLVAGVGLRAFAWLANGLNATAVRVRAAAEGGGEDTVVVPDAMAAELARVMPSFQRAVGFWDPPSPIGARGSRVVAGSLGDPTENKKAADEAIGRLAKRLDQVRARKAPVLFAHYPVVAAPPPRTLDASRIIEFRPTGPRFASPPRSAGGEVAVSPSRRLVQLLTHPRKAWKHLLILAALGGAGAWLAYGLRGASRRHEESLI
ncbi:MAG TPA: hypothetical protein VFS00_21140 [Polyangiaceae bacterium]|nr:hypothetical protein [Polyangiaceae bacterium]